MLNSGTIIGPSDLMRRHFVLIIEQIEQHWQCRRAHGSDQAMHNFLVYTGKVIEAGRQHSLSALISLLVYSFPIHYVPFLYFIPCFILSFLIPHMIFNVPSS